MNFSGRFILRNAFHSNSRCTESYAFDISCETNQYSLSFSYAYSCMFVNHWISPVVDVLGKAELFLILSTFFCPSILFNLLFNIFVKIFLECSISVIGLVCVKSPSKSFFLGIGYTTPWLQFFGTVSSIKQ